jgi:hypothetical protein
MFTGIELVDLAPKAESMINEKEERDEYWR